MYNNEEKKHSESRKRQRNWHIIHVQKIKWLFLDVVKEHDVRQGRKMNSLRGYYSCNYKTIEENEKEETHK